MNRFYILLLAIIWTVGPTGAQSLKQFKDEAVKATQKKDFGKSFSLYDKIINEADEKTSDNYYQAAESARKFRLYIYAEKYYKEVQKDSAALNRYRLTNYHLGTVLKSQGKYDEAIATFKSFLERDAAFTDEKYVDKADKEIIDCEWAKTVTDDGTIVEHLDTTVNTPNSEFGPFEYDSTLYYSSVRFYTDRKYEPLPPLTRIFASDQIHDGEQVADDFNMGEKLHSGNIAFNADQTRIYYTICNNVNVSEMHCKIYFRDKSGDNWGPVDSLSNVINSNTYTSTQPSVGIEKESGKEILFFVSDRLVDTTDHYRDLNIWCSYKEENGEWGEPGYIDSVNTEGDDVTPFFDSKTQTLYFSSNGLRNLGGFDIYRIQKKGSEWGEIIGMGSPVNTSYDEMYYTMNAGGSAAYMSSNRPGGSCDPLDSLCVCNDIYRMPQICLDVRTFNKLTTLPLNGTEVVLKESNMDTLDIQSKPDDYIYSFFVGHNRSYAVDGSKDGRWLPDMLAFNTTEMKGDGCDTIDLFLEPLVDLNVYTCDKITGEPLSGVTVTISVVDSSDAGFPKTDAMNLGAQSHFDLSFGRKYKIVATKEGYTTDVSYRTITEDIERVPTTLRDDLCICELPPRPELKLYFANDEPGPHTRRDTLAEADYTHLVGAYADGKNSFFDFSRKKQKKVTKKLQKEKKEIENKYRNSSGPEILIRDSLLNRIDSLMTLDSLKVDKFFNKVGNGKKELEKFTLDLCGYLKLTPEGDSITVEVRGFASPIGPDNAGVYNKALSKRRIDSIRKYFNNNLPEDQFPKLRVITVANGSAKSDKSVPKFGDEAIFGLNSSEERRVEIIGVKLSKCIDLRTISTEGCPNSGSY